MKIFINSRAISGAWGGANSFLNALCHEFRRYGIKVTHDSNDEFDIALLNALVPDVNLELVQSIHARGIPIMHRKVGYETSGGEKMQRLVDGVVFGEKLQLDFTPYLKMSIFQSNYSRDVFLKSGYDGNYVVIWNGVNDKIFHPYVQHNLFGGTKLRLLFSKLQTLLKKRNHLRPFWNGNEPLKVIMSSWAKAKTKGFPTYKEIDKQLAGRNDIHMTYVGRMPDDMTFDHIHVCEPLPHPKLASLLREHHVILQLAEKETCSNALLEGISCGLPAIYLDSGSNKEIAGEYGVEFRGDFFDAIEEVKANYHFYVNRTLIHPYRISLAAQQYRAMVHQVYGFSFI